MRIVLAAIAASSVLSFGAVAESQQRRSCVEPVPPEVVKSGQRLSEKDIASQLVGKTIVYVRPRISAYGFVRYFIEIRPDGSLAHWFEVSGYRDGPWRRGDYFVRSDGKIEHGGRSVGVWAIRNGRVCGRLVMHEAETCYEIIAANGTYYAHPPVSGHGGCLEGAISIQ